MTQEELVKWAAYQACTESNLDHARRLTEAAEAVLHMVDELTSLRTRSEALARTARTIAEEYCDGTDPCKMHVLHEALNAWEAGK